MCDPKEDGEVNVEMVLLLCPAATLWGCGCGSPSYNRATKCASGRGCQRRDGKLSTRHASVVRLVSAVTVAGEHLRGGVGGKLPAASTCDGRGIGVASGRRTTRPTRAGNARLSLEGLRSSGRLTLDKAAARGQAADVRMLAETRGRVVLSSSCKKTRLHPRPHHGAVC